MQVAGSAASVREGLALAEQTEPDIVLIDLTIPECQPAIREIGRRVPAARVVVLALPDEESELLAFAEAGVAGFVPRGASLAELVAALESAARGELLVPPRAAAALLRRVSALAAGASDAGGSAALTARESEIARLIDDGKSNKEIARGLGIEVATVKNHVHNILAKLGLQRRGEVPRTVRAYVLHRYPAPRG